MHIDAITGGALQSPDTHVHNNWHDPVYAPDRENLSVAIQRRSYVGVNGSVSLSCWVNVSPERIFGV